jgi:hypothetical protein
MANKILSYIFVGQFVSCLTFGIGNHVIGFGRYCFPSPANKTNLTNRNSRILINRWLCGNIANHQTCKKCQGTSSRIHVIQCTGIETAIMNIDPQFLLCHSPYYNAMDQAFQFLYHSSNSASYEVMATCIKKIYIECLGYKKADKGYWNFRH